MLRRLLSFVVLISLLGSSARAADADLDKPYDLDVVLHVGKHRLLTDVFAGKVRRELEDGLRAAFGRMANVRVVTTHPRLSELVDKGLKSMDGWKDLTGRKTHFVLISYDKGRYHVEARQHDGLTGQASAVAREITTADRPFVARLATLMIDRDFGIVGSLPASSQPDQGLTIQLHGAKLAKNLEHWVKPGEVFRVVPIYVGRKETYPVPHAVLQVTSGPSEKGECRCRLHYRYADPLKAAPGLLGYRCLKLGTIRAPLHLRFVKRGPRNNIYPAGSLSLIVRRQPDQKLSDAIEDLTDDDGYWSSERYEDKGKFEHLVFVTAKTGGGGEAFIPVPLVSESPVLLAVDVRQPGLEDALLLRVTSWTKRAHDYDVLLAQLFAKLAKLGTDAKEVQLAVDDAKRELALSIDALKQLRKDREGLIKDAKDDGKAIQLGDGERHLASLAKGHGELQEFIVAQERILLKQDNPKVKGWLEQVAKGKLAEQRANFAEALTLYDAVIKDGYSDATTIKHRDELHAAWAIKNDAHRKARDFIYNEWPKLDSAEAMQPRLKDIAEAVRACADNKDKLTPQKFLMIATEHVAKLEAQKEALRADINQEDFEMAKRIAEVVTALKDPILLAQRIVAP